MTSPSSYLFYDRTKPLGRGTHFQRVFVTDDKITVYKKRMIKTRKAGVPFEQVLSQMTYKRCTNKHGQKYLQILSRSATRKFSDYAMMNTLGIGPLNLFPECQKLLDDTLEGWFGDLYDRLDTGKQDGEQARKLVLPAFRDPHFPQLGASLRADLSDSTGMVVKALRENDSWAGFVKMMCGDTVKTDADVALLRNNPSLLRLAVMKLGTTISEFNARTNAGLKLNAASPETKMLSCMFSWTIYTCLEFMFKYLPQADREIALKLMLGLAEMTKENLSKFNDGVSHLGGQLPYKRIPTRLRPELAQLILTTLSESYEKLAGDTPSDEAVRFLTPMHFSPTHPTLHTMLSDNIATWFATTVTMPSLQTALTVSDIKTRFTEILGVEFPGENQYVRFYSEGDTEFCTMKDRATPKPQRYEGLLTSFLNLAKPSQMRGLYANPNTRFNGYLKEGKFEGLNSPIYSLDDLMALMDKAALELDRRLTKLGRDITPANRVAYLSFGKQEFGAKERDYKNTWFYYDLGITDIERILVYKKARIRSKKEVGIYKELPEEMFQELTALAGGLKQEFASAF